MGPVGPCRCPGYTGTVVSTNRTVVRIAISPSRVRVLTLHVLSVGSNVDHARHVLLQGRGANIKCAGMHTHLKDLSPDTRPRMTSHLLRRFGREKSMALPPPATHPVHTPPVPLSLSPHALRPTRHQVDINRRRRQRGNNTFLRQTSTVPPTCCGSCR